MNNDSVTANTALAGGFGLAVLGTTCCTLPIILVTLGLGSVVASIVAALPVLAWLSQYKAVTFSVAGLVLTYSWWRLGRARQSGQCAIEDSKRQKWQTRVLWINTFILLAALFATYALLPITLWLG